MSCTNCSSEFTWPIVSSKLTNNIPEVTHVAYHSTLCTGMGYTQFGEFFLKELVDLFQVRHVFMTFRSNGDKLYYKFGALKREDYKWD